MLQNRRKITYPRAMWDLDYESVREITAVLESHGFAMSKKFGQNFLLPESVRSRIADLAGNIKGKAVWEVGPGLGALTEQLIKRGAVLTCFEIDHGFANILNNEAFFDESLFSLVEGDALKTMKGISDHPYAIMGNLPYNVGSLIIADIIERAVLPEIMVFTLQKEVVDRMDAKPGNKDYSSFSVLCQLDYTPYCAFCIGRKNFFPEPNVDSAVVVLKKKEGLYDIDRKSFSFLVRTLFSQRRKTVRNNLIPLVGKDRVDQVLEAAEISPAERAENLFLEDILRLHGGIC